MATYFVDGAVGSDANAGTSAGAGNAWATVQKAANTATAGDKVWVKASATYAELVSFNTGAHTGTGASRLVFEGYTTTTGDGGRATITGSGSRASCVVFDGTMDYISIVNFDLTSPTTQCIIATGQVDGLVLDNVRMLKGSSTPAKGMTGNGYGRFATTILTRCVVSGGFSSNGLEGFAGGLIEDTVITGCGGNGYSGQGYMNAPEFRRCLVTLNTGDGLHFPGAQTNIFVNNCTIDGNGGDGIDVGGANNQTVVIRNNLITNHTAVGAKGVVVGAESGHDHGLRGLQLLLEQHGQHLGHEHVRCPRRHHRADRGPVHERRRLQLEPERHGRGRRGRAGRGVGDQRRHQRRLPRRGCVAARRPGGRDDLRHFPDHQPVLHHPVTGGLPCPASTPPASRTSRSPPRRT
jgi:hypothetical protein